MIRFFSRSRLMEFILLLLIISIAFVLFYWRLFFAMNNFLSFGNFTQTLNLGELREFFPFYNPFSNFGSVSSFPLENIEYSAIAWLVILPPSIIFDVSIGVKVFIFISSLFFGLSFYVLTSIFTKKYLARILGTMFFLFNPFTIQLYASGDFYEFIFQSFIFIGLVFLHYAITKGKFFHPYYIISVFFLILSFAVLQSVLTAFILYFVSDKYVTKNNNTNQ